MENVLKMTIHLKRTISSDSDRFTVILLHFRIVFNWIINVSWGKNVEEMDRVAMIRRTSDTFLKNANNNNANRQRRLIERLAF